MGVNAAYLKRKYGLEPLHIEQLLASCDHRCPACTQPFNQDSRPYCVDHDHKTGMVRGLLCRQCNDAIGFRHDKLSWFKRVWEYLFNPPAVKVIGRRYVPGSPGAEGIL